jgi:LysR family nitrogen assimilation transcriptional regulator
MRYFTVIAEKRSLASAAVCLGVAQPSLSQHVKSLEQRLGVELLVRSPRGVELTEAGQVFLLHARKILEATKIAREEVRLAGTEPIGQVVFGFPSSVSMVLSVALAETLRQDRPKIRFRAVEAMSGFIRNWLEDGTVDLAILYDIGNLKTAHSQFLLAEDLHYYCAADDWKFATPPGQPLTFAQVAGCDLVLPSATHGLRQFLEHYARAARLSLNVVVEMDSLSQILSLVSLGNAATILAPAAAHQHEANRTLLSAPIVEPLMRRPVYLVRNTARMVTRASREVEKITIDVVRELVRRRIWNAHLSEPTPSPAALPGPGSTAAAVIS